MKLRTRLLIFSSIFLLLLPWLGFHFAAKVERSLLQGQEEAQSMAASVIATILRGYTDLFEVDENAIYVYPVQQNMVMDGYAEDWGKLEAQFSAYAEGKFSLLLATNEQYLYVYLKVHDDYIVYRNPRYIPLDSSDHIRLEYLDENKHRRRLVLLAEGQGRVSVYEVNPDWQLWTTGQHMASVYGNWRETGSGYDVEFRMPRKWLKSSRMSIAVVNVFGENERNPDTILSTAAVDTGRLNPLLFRSRQISNVIRNLNESTSRICVVDKYRRVRAVIGGQTMPVSLCQTSDRVSESLVSTALRGERQSTRYEDQGDTLIVAAHPVFDDDDIIGAVLVSKNSDQILASQRDTLRDVIFATIGLFVLFSISLLAFSSWLTYRINRLKNETSSLIDDSGRFVNKVDLSDRGSRDEIGDLCRSFSSLLEDLDRYMHFLETVPGMLRHEILNPVNTLSMSLQNLQIKQASSAANASNEISTANSSIRQLQLIVSSLTEAASIDDVLAQDAVEVFDMAALLTEYVVNSQAKHQDFMLEYQGEKEGVFVRGNDIRMVQLLDKIKDNALDFSLADTSIIFQLDTGRDEKLILRVKNQGTVLSQQQIDSLFKGIFSRRCKAERAGEIVPHLGIGLYIAAQIAQFHQGELQIANWKSVDKANQGYKQGVEVILILPITDNI